ncbi:MAG: hypothetical protein JWO38_1776 [Gemmataceae bacterium]|nr:hypothetical protein [Gemmataceae bacterium]
MSKRFWVPLCLIGLAAVLRAGPMPAGGLDLSRIKTSLLRVVRETVDRHRE